MVQSKEFAFEKLNSQNYPVWKFRMRMLLIKEGLENIVFSEKAEEEEKFVEKDKLARAIISLNVGDSQIINILNETSAKGTWEKLKNVHEKASLSGRLYLLKKLYSTRYAENMHMRTFLNDVLQQIEKLKNLGDIIPETHVCASAAPSQRPGFAGFFRTASCLFRIRAGTRSKTRRKTRRKKRQAPGVIAGQSHIARRHRR